MNFVLMPQSAVVASIVVVAAAVCQTSSLSNVISILILHYILMMNGLKRPLKKVNSWIVLVIVEL